ncbi:MAG: hypothetical protein MUD14_25005 [Hydrococcus sp. Prado102]|nr:hypothetical protein [Hydrococcus sp. Prado102]
MTIVFQGLFAVAALSFLGLVTFATILAALKDDTKGCTFSPDNSGCVLNRPFDREKMHQTEENIF